MRATKSLEAQSNGHDSDKEQSKSSQQGVYKEEEELIHCTVVGDREVGCSMLHRCVARRERL